MPKFIYISSECPILANFYFTTPYDLFELTGIQYFCGWCLLKLPYWLMLIVTILTLYSGVIYMLEHKSIFKEALT